MGNFKGGCGKPLTTVANKADPMERTHTQICGQDENSVSGF
jgi:hypothetical protein